MSSRLLPNKKDFHSMLCDGNNICIQSPAGVDFHVNDTVDKGTYWGEGQAETREVVVSRMEVWALVKPMK